MSLFNIPVADNPDNVFTIVLDGVAYDIRLHWNGRDESWYLSLGLTNQPFLIRTKLSSGTDILKPYRSYEECPNGILIAIDYNKLYGRLQRDSFSSGRFRLMYITGEVLEAFKEAKLV